MKSSNLLLYAATLALLAGASTRTAATGPRFSGEVFTWGKDQVTGVVASDAVAIGGGVYHNIILKRDGTVVSWGWNTNASITPPPTAPPGLSNVTAIAAGYFHNVALKRDGTVLVWGNYSGDITNTPPGLSRVLSISAGWGHTLAVKADHTVAAWGFSYHGETNVPPALGPVRATACGTYHSLALKSGGTVAAWGDNQFGQSTVPAGLSNVIAIAAGAYHNLALTGNGRVIAWGYSEHGQTNVPPDLAWGNYLGTIATWGWNYLGAMDVPADLARVTAIACAPYHSLAIDTRPQLDQSVTPVAPNQAMGIRSLTFYRGQTFTVGQKGVLSSVSLCLNSCSAQNTADIIVAIRGGIDFTWPALTTGRIPASAIPYVRGCFAGTGGDSRFVNAGLSSSSPGLLVRPGQVYTIWAHSSNQTDEYGWWADPGDTYPGGTARTRDINGDNVEFNFDVGFKTYVLPVDFSLDAIANANSATALSTSGNVLVVLAPDNSRAVVVLDGSQSTDPDGDSLDYAWYASDDSEPFATGVRATNYAPVGTHEITLQVSDLAGISTDTITVEVITPAEAVAELLASVENSNLARQDKRQLTSNLQEAIRAYERDNFRRGNNQLEMFVRKAQSRAAPTNPTLANAWIRSATAILNAMAAGAE